MNVFKKLPQPGEFLLPRSAAGRFCVLRHEECAYYAHVSAAGVSKTRRVKCFLSFTVEFYHRGIGKVSHSMSNGGGIVKRDYAPDTSKLY